MKPMKPPEFDSDEELARDRGRLPSSSGEEETTGEIGTERERREGEKKDGVILSPKEVIF